MIIPIEYNEGRIAALRAANREDNPYSEDSILHDWWEQGWEDIQREENGDIDYND
jgi:hypothetical protein